MLTIPTAFADPKLHRSHQWATCWRIERADGVVLRFTNHDRLLTLVVDDAAQHAQQFAPLGGWNASNHQRESGVKESHLQVFGVLTSSAITDDDLRAGKYRSARVEEYLVDWRAPERGPMRTNKYVIAETTRRRSVWEARVEGLPRWLRVKVGAKAGRTCRHVFGDSLCTVDLGPRTHAGEVTAVHDGRRVRFFTDLGALAVPTQALAVGFVEWKAGAANVGVRSPVRYNITTDGEIGLLVPTPYDIEVGDEFDAVEGCNKLFSTCRNRFNNGARFGGFPHIPGRDRMMRGK